MRAALLAVAGVVFLTTGLVLAAALLWSLLAGLSVGLVVVGGGFLYAGLTFDLDRKE